MEDRVRVEVSDHVATVTLARADKHNALDRAMFDAIVEAAEQVAATPGVRAVVLHGDGPSFCSGIDVTSAFSADAGLDGGLEDALMTVPNRFQRTAYDWVTLPVPVIAAIHGNCLGGGLQIALGADIRIATGDARLSVMEVKWGLIPDMSISRTLPRLVGIDVAKELTFTGRVFSGEEALGLGVVTQACRRSAGGGAGARRARSPDGRRTPSGEPSGCSTSHGAGRPRRRSRSKPRSSSS